jgi:peptide/nickel transport system substrate-binding protein
MRANRDIVVGKPRAIDQFLAVLNVNHADPPFNNIKVRKALQAAIVQSEIMAAVGLPDDPRHAVLRFDLHVQCPGIDRCRHRGAEGRRRGTGAPAPQGVGVRRRARSSSFTPGPQPCSIRSAWWWRAAAPAGFNVQVESRDSATMQQRRLQRTGWSIVPIVSNGIA